MAHNESPSGGTWLAWQHFIPWWQSFLFKEYTKYVQDFLQESKCPLNLYDLRRAQQIWKRLLQLFFFSSTWHLAPLIFRMVGRFSLSSLYIHIPQGHYTLTLYFSLPLLYKAFYGHVIPKLLFIFFFLMFCSGFWVHTQKAGAHSAASSGTLSSSSHHKAVWILKLWLINNAFQQNINPFPPISYNYSLK